MTAALNRIALSGKSPSIPEGAQAPGAVEMIHQARVKPPINIIGRG
jgi:hypothetical protein